MLRVGTWAGVHAAPLSGAGITVTLPAASQWRAVHVLVDGCKCSRDIAVYLAHRGPAPHWQEEIWFLDAAAEPPSVPGFPVRTPDTQTVTASGIVGGPRLLLFSPAGDLVWTGGYRPARRRLIARPGDAANIVDREVMDQATRGLLPAPIPVYGCPRSDLLRTF